MIIFFWFVASLISAVSFAFIEVLILGVAINNLHYAIYFSIFGITGFYCRHRALGMIKKNIKLQFLYKTGSYFISGILIIGCIALLANAVTLIIKFN